MNAVADVRGLKRVCIGCGTRFYDMNKRPITCPSCDTEFTGELKVKGRRGKAVPEKPKDDVKTPDEGQVTEATAANDGADDEDDDGEDDPGVEIVSLDDDQAMGEATGQDDETATVDLGTIEGGDLDDIEDVEDDGNALPDPDAEIEV